MIKLVLQHNSHSQAFTFHKECITIGDGAPEAVDISIVGLGLHQNHIRIYKKDGDYFISNQANDPFITLNNIPFGKKKLHLHDIIKIKNTSIVIQELDDEQTDTCIDAETKPHNPLRNLEEEICDYPNAENLSKEDGLEGLFPSDLSRLGTTKLKRDQIHGSTPSEDLETHLPSSAPAPFFTIKKLKWLAILFLVTTIVGGAISIETYLRAASRSGTEESKAAESLADIAMALNYAKVFQVVPQKHNFSDPEFIKNNLTALLPAHAPLNGTINTQGQFSNCSYIFRFYSEQGLSRFLIIAQPAPSLSQWLFPKKAIVIDSSLMDLRMISDLKAINGLLASSKPFEGHNGRELSEAIKKLKILPLAQLAHSSKKKEFAPPRIVKYLRPCAENLIYNAPRYYHFTAPLLKKILMEETSSNHSHLASEIEKYAAFDHLIIYTSEGLQAANKAHKTLAQSVPNNNFLTGLLLLSPTEEILTSRLLVDIEHTPESPPIALPNTNEIAALEKKLAPHPITNPVSKKLEQFSQTANQALAPLLQKMANLLKQSMSHGVLDRDFYLLLESYQLTEAEHKERLHALIANIRKSYPSLSYLELYQHLKQHRLESWVYYPYHHDLMPSFPHTNHTPKITPPLKRSHSLPSAQPLR
ncbi:MAG: hypothetical protein ACSNEK_07795 [Parachlamydiaceae bacterium]